LTFGQPAGIDKINHLCFNMVPLEDRFAYVNGGAPVFSSPEKLWFYMGGRVAWAARFPAKTSGFIRLAGLRILQKMLGFLGVRSR
jgi:hypothetical protein